MNKLETSGTYVATVQGQEYIILVNGSAPMLRVTRVFNLSKFLEDGSVNDDSNVEVLQKISENPSDYNYRPIDLNTTFKIREIGNKVGNIEYSKKEYAEWLQAAGKLDKSSLIAKIMLQKKEYTYPMCEILVEQLWKDKRQMLSK